MKKAFAVAATILASLFSLASHAQSPLSSCSFEKAECEPIVECRTVCDPPRVPGEPPMCREECTKTPGCVAIYSCSGQAVAVSGSTAIDLSRFDCSVGGGVLFCGDQDGARSALFPSSAVDKINYSQNSSTTIAPELQRLLFGETCSVVDPQIVGERPCKDSGFGLELPFSDGPMIESFVAPITEDEISTSIGELCDRDAGGDWHQCIYNGYGATAFKLRWKAQ